MYLYPRRSTATQYYYGTAWITLGTIIAGGVTDKSKSSANLKGASALAINP
jgi:carbon starvation protein CstA